jgi:ankyrin repeat protein
MYAAWENPNAAVLVALLDAGADAKVKSNSGKTAFDYALDNEKLKGTDALRQLEEAST